MTLHQEHHSVDQLAMARTWFAGPRPAQIVPPSKGAVSKTGEPASSNKGVLSKNKTVVNVCATAHQTTPNQATHSDSDSDGPVTWATPLSTPQKELNTQQTKEVIDASIGLAKLRHQHSKPKEPQTPTTFKFKDATTSKPVRMMDALAPSPSAQRRAPTAQMVPLPANAAATTTPAAIIHPEKPTTSPSGPCPSTMNASNSQAYFPMIAPTSLSLSSSLQSSPTAYTRPTPTKPPITLTPAPATAPSAFKDAALAAHVQNTRVLSSTKQQTNKVKKRQYVRTSSPLKSASTPESVSEGKRGRGRPCTRAEEQPLQQSRQHRQPVQPFTPFPPTGFPNPSRSSLSALPAFPTQHQQTVTFRSNGDPNPTLCSEEPRLWPGRGDYVATLYRFNVRPETIHSAPIYACANHAAHQDPQALYGHGVCTTCRHGAIRHLKVTKPELLGSAWWELCKTCGDNEMLRFEPARKGCTCCKKWLCFSCQTEEIERRGMKNSVEAEVRRRTLVGVRMDRGLKTVTVGWACKCGRDIGPDATLSKCIGCRGMRVGGVEPQEAAAREKTLRKTALAWT